MILIKPTSETQTQEPKSNLLERFSDFTGLSERQIIYLGLLALSMSSLIAYASVHVSNFQATGSW